MLRKTCVLVLAAIGPLRAEVPVENLLEEKMNARIRALDMSIGGVLGVAAIDLTSGHTFAYNGDVVFPTASSIKIAILIQMFRAIQAGEFQLADSLTLSPAQSVGGSGQLQRALKSGPLTLTVRELITDMIRDSDNTATNKCIAMAKMERINRLLEEFGFRATRLRRIMMDNAAAERGDENTSTPVELARLVEMLYRGKAADPQSCVQMLDIMKLVKGDLRATIPPSIETASKTGSLEGVRCETGIVYLPGRPFVVGVFSTFLDPGSNPVGEAMKIVYQHFLKLAGANQYGHKLR